MTATGAEDLPYAVRLALEYMRAGAELDTGRGGWARLAHPDGRVLHLCADEWARVLEARRPAS